MIDLDEDTGNNSASWTSSTKRRICSSIPVSITTRESYREDGDMAGEGGVWSRRWNYKFIVKQSSLDINKGELGKVLTLTTLNQRLARYI